MSKDKSVPVIAGTRVLRAADRRKLRRARCSPLGPAIGAWGAPSRSCDRAFDEGGAARCSST